MIGLKIQANFLNILGVSKELSRCVSILRSAIAQRHTLLPMEDKVIIIRTFYTKDNALSLLLSK